jgi:hypothetical protein
LAIVPNPIAVTIEKFRAVVKLKSFESELVVVSFASLNELEEFLGIFAFD